MTYSDYHRVKIQSRSHAKWAPILVPKPRFFASVPRLYLCILSLMVTILDRFSSNSSKHTFLQYSLDEFVSQRKPYIYPFFKVVGGVPRPKLGSTVLLGGPNYFGFWGSMKKGLLMKKCLLSPNDVVEEVNTEMLRLPCVCVSHLLD